ncbi:putative fungal-specific transcription factor, partial [Mollisia scopiformis]
MQTPSSGESGLDLARQVCTSCKTRKRKCDKAFPRCSSCAKSNLTCQYLTVEEKRKSETPAADHGPLWHDLSASQSHAELNSIDFSTILFLDPSLLQHGQVETAQAATLVPAHLPHLLGDMDEIRAITSRFFQHVHLWMPFICRKRFYDHHLRPPFQAHPDVVLLLLSIKLITTFPPTNPRNPRTLLYNAVKHFHLEVEGSSVSSILVLQAGVLIALYELGHAIYPAAYMSIGACARYAYALGIHVSGVVSTRKVLTLVEVEERRRVWWAIVILDRFVSIGCPGRKFATVDPTLDDLLPSDDEAWDQGIVNSDDFVRLSSPMAGHMSKFGLLCQAARLLGQVLQNVSRDSTNDDDDGWMQLDRTLQSMLTASLNVPSPDYDRITFIYSTLVALYTPQLDSNDPRFVETNSSRRARVGIQQITETIKGNLVDNDCFFGRNPEELSPWGIFFAYHICAIHMRSSRENPASLLIVKSLKETFRAIDIRWNAAGSVYLQLLEAREVM